MGMHRSEGATELLGMDGFVAGAAVEVDGEWWLAVETTAVTVGCEGCDSRAVGHGRREVRVRDLPMVTAGWCSCGASACGAVPSPTAR